MTKLLIGIVLTCLVLLAGLVAAAPPVGKSIQDVLQLLEQYRPDPARSAEMARTLAAEPPAGSEGAALARFYLERGRVAAEAGMIARQIADFRRVVELGGGPTPARTYKELALAEFQGGDFAAALA
ncbi:MAG: hypothetical protein RIR00_2653, partial [Pseudomonadota bacterium]